MPAKRFFKALLTLCFLVGSLLACSVNIAAPATNNDSSSATSTADLKLNAWTQGVPGVEVRYEHWQSPGNNEDTVAIVRIDLHRTHLSIGYQPDQPLLMSQWMKQTGATAIINGGYFNTSNQATGMVISDGQTFGTSYNGFGGMLATDMQGNVTLRSLSQQPYDPGEQLQQATQSSPMLMVDGKRTQFNANAASQRRSVVAMDTQGRLLLIASSNPAFSLDELADLLVSSDLSIKTALNLDGGASTSLYVRAGNQHVSIDPITPLPIVIVVK